MDFDNKDLDKFKSFKIYIPCDLLLHILQILLFALCSGGCIMLILWLLSTSNFLTLFIIGVIILILSVFYNMRPLRLVLSSIYTSFVFEKFEMLFPGLQRCSVNKKDYNLASYGLYPATKITCKRGVSFETGNEKVVFCELNFYDKIQQNNYKTFCLKFNLEIDSGVQLISAVKPLNCNLKLEAGLPVMNTFFMNYSSGDVSKLSGLVDYSFSQKLAKIHIICGYSFKMILTGKTLYILWDRKRDNFVLSNFFFFSTRKRVKADFKQLEQFYLISKEISGIESKG